jgi:nucleoside-diphosphate-sugar epimerase
MTRPTLITGADGFIGTHMKARLPEALPLWLGFNTEDEIARLQPTRIYHLAAWGVLPSDRHIGAMLKNNVMRHGQLLDAVRHYVPDCHVICAGSCFDDDVNDYGHTKRLAREMAEYYREHYQLKIAVLRLFQVYGPGESASRLVPSIIHACLEHRPVVLHNPSSVRSWLYVIDAVEAFVKTEHTETEDVGGDILPVRGMAERIMKVLGTMVPIQRGIPQDDAARTYVPRIPSLRHSVTSLDEGIRAHARSLDGRTV